MTSWALEAIERAAMARAIAQQRVEYFAGYHVSDLWKMIEFWEQSQIKRGREMVEGDL